MFYPQLVAGPIERPQNLIHQFYEEHYFDYVRVTDGLKLMAWGMFKKVVIADRLAIVANQVFNNATDYTGLTIIIATIFFTFQIFCDFSGYSDIAIGAAQVMGFKLMLNFNRPYFSKSMAEFWRRWHISLSSWFRDYVFMPLERTKGPKWKWIYITFITFILSGLWHGANWTFVLWGGLNGVYITFSLLTRRFRNKLIALSGLPKYPGLYKFVQVGVTFFFICFAIVFFRSRSVSDIFYLLSHSVIGLDFTPKGISESLSGLGFNKYDYITAFISIGFMETVHLFQRSGSIRDQVRKKPAWFRWALYYGLLFCILKFGVFNRTEFIYFQF
jgi:D-alanyl-lipoteichoic acid acyltransferase DltB (MBOAT superfamily)